MYGEECCSNKKNVCNRQYTVLSWWAWVEKTFHGVETHWLSGKEKVLGIADSKGAHADSLLGYERTHHYLFPWKKYHSKQYFLLPTI